MSSSSSLENEDLDHVPLVRMEDVQPSRERITKDEDGGYETYIIDDIGYENECIVNDDDDSNIGSMVSLQSEDMYEEDSSSQELIIPEVLEEIETENEENFVEEYLDDDLEADEDNIESLETADYLDVPIVHEDVEQQIDAEILASKELNLNEVEVPPNKAKRVEEIIINPPSESWPTLEILPGGVIKNTDKYESGSDLYSDKIQETVTNKPEMMYACAKCSQTFKYLFCLVKHVKWHEDQKKIMRDPHKVAKLKNSSNQYICLHTDKKKILATERNKRKTPKRLKS